MFRCKELWCGEQRAVAARELSSVAALLSRASPWRFQRPNLCASYRDQGPLYPPAKFEGEALIGHRVAIALFPLFRPGLKEGLEREFPPVLTNRGHKRRRKSEYSFNGARDKGGTTVTGGATDCLQEAQPQIGASEPQSAAADSTRVLASVQDGAAWQRPLLIGDFLAVRGGLRVARLDRELVPSYLWILPEAVSLLMCIYFFSSS